MVCASGRNMYKRCGSVQALFTTDNDWKLHCSGTFILLQAVFQQLSLPFYDWVTIIGLTNG